MSDEPMVAILAGGEGQRMGGGKPLRAYGAATLLDNAIGLARSWSRTCVIAVRRPEQLPPGYRDAAIADDPGIEGPLGGLSAALACARARGARRLLTIPCDAPRLPLDLAGRLEEGLAESVLVAVAASAGQRHPTCALWSVEAHAKLDGYAASGRRSLNGFADYCGARVVTWALAHDGDPFANANTPEELAALQPRGDRA